MSLLTKKISFSIYRITSIKDEKAFVEFLTSLPPRDIKDEPEVSAYFFTDPLDTDKSGFHLTNESLSFCYRVDKKQLPKKRHEALLQAELERIRDEEGRVLDKKKDKQEIQMLGFKIAQEMSLGQNPVETSLQIIIDRNSNLLFVEKRGGMTEEAVGLLAYSGGMYCEKVLPFEGEDKKAKSERLKDFTSWLYESMSNKSNYIESGSIKLGTNIKLQDSDSEVTIKGNITKYIKTYNSVMDEGRVKECRVFFNDEDNQINLQYSLNCQDLYFSSYISSGYAPSKNDKTLYYDSLESRREDLLNFVEHFKNLADYFEEYSKLEGTK